MKKEFISGVLVTKVKQISNFNGSVLHMLRSKEKDFKKFGEIYFSEIFPGKIKAWKKNKKNTQNFVVPIGNILLVIYDDRNNSRTKGNILEIKLGRPNHYNRVHIPKNLWYGFSCLGKKTALIANQIDFIHNKKNSLNLTYNNNKIPYKWEEN